MSNDNGWRFIAWWLVYGVVDVLGEWAYRMGKPASTTPEWFSALFSLTVFISLWICVIKKPTDPHGGEHE